MNVYKRTETQRQMSLMAAVLHTATMCLLEPSFEAQLPQSTLSPTDPANPLIISAAGSQSPQVLNSTTDSFVLHD